MKKTLLILILIGLMDTQAQTSNTFKTGGGGFTIGMGAVNLKALQPYVNGRDLSKNGSQLIFGITGNKKYRRTMTGLTAGIMIGEKIKTDSLNYSFSGLSGSFDFGYLIVDQEHFKCFPMIGLGLNNYGVKIKRQSDESIPSVVTYSDRPIKIYNTGINLDLSINFRFISNYKTNPKDQSKAAFMSGLKIGYVHGFDNSIWRYTGGSITNGPAFGMRMYYIKLVLGGFGYTQVKK